MQFSKCRTYKYSKRGDKILLKHDMLHCIISICNNNLVLRYVKFSIKKMITRQRHFVCWDNGYVIWGTILLHIWACILCIGMGLQPVNGVRQVNYIWTIRGIRSHVEHALNCRFVIRPVRQKRSPSEWKILFNWFAVCQTKINDTSAAYITLVIVM